MRPAQTLFFLFGEMRILLVQLFANCQTTIFEMSCHYQDGPNQYNYIWEVNWQCIRNLKDSEISSKQQEKKSGITIENLAYKVGITERYLYRIENEEKKPSFDVLYKLIRELSISPDLIFYPEKPSKDSEVENLLRMLSDCDERSLEVVKVTVKALIDTAPEK